MKLAAIILAGGEGRRIGGAKPMRLLGGERLIDRAGTLAAQWSEIVAVAVRDPEQVVGTSLTCVFDDPDIAGPLAGLAAALRFGVDRGCEAVLTIPADMPFLPGNLALRLAQELGTASASLAGSSGHLHPVCGLWRVSAVDHLETYAATGKRSLRGFAEAVGHHAVWWPGEPIDPFFNINCSEDLAVAERLLGN